MTGDLTSQGLIDYRRSVVKAIPTATVFFPGGQTRRYSIEGSPLCGSLGIYRDRLRDIGTIDYRLSDPRGGLQSVTTTLRVADMDGDIRAIVRKYGVSGLRGSVVTIDAATESSVSDWRRDMTGVIDGIVPSSGLEWSIVVRVDDRPLVDGTFRAPRLSQTDYPDALAPNLERFMPIALGIFDSNDGTVAGSIGSVELIRLGESNGTGGFPYRYLVMAPFASWVGRVHVNGTTQASSTWVRTYTVRNGMSTTEVWLSSDPGASAKVTAEIHGVGEDVPGSSTYLGSSGTGAPIVNVVRQIRWLLRNYVWGAYRTGAYAADPSVLSAATWDAAETWAEQRRFRGCVYIKGADQRPIDVFNAFCQWVWIRAGWTRQGTLALYPFTDEDAPYFSDTRWIRYALKGSESAFLPSFPRDRSTHAIRSASWLVPSSGSSRSVVSVRDSRITGNVVTEVNHPLGVARQKFQDGYPGGSPLILALNGSRLGAQGDSLYLTSGSALSRWRDINWSPAALANDFPNSYRTAMTMTPPIGAEPTWHAGVLNGHGVVRFDGTNDRMTSAASGVVSATDKTVWVVFRAASAAAKSSPGSEEMIIGDDGGAYWGLSVYDDAGTYYLEAHNYDGTLDTVRQVIQLNTWTLARMEHVQGALRLSVNNWDFATVSSGATSVIGKIQIGANYLNTKFFHGDIAAILIWNSGTLAAQGAVSGTSLPGLGVNFDVFQSLKDRYRI